jgi:hypothetical protein
MPCLAPQAATIAYLQGLMDKTKGTPEELTQNMIVPFKAVLGPNAQCVHVPKGFGVRWCNLKEGVAAAKLAGSGSAGVCLRPGRGGLRVHCCSGCQATCKHCTTGLPVHLTASACDHVMGQACTCPPVGLHTALVVACVQMVARRWRKMTI